MVSEKYNIYSTFYEIHEMRGFCHMVILRCFFARPILTMGRGEIVCLKQSMKIEKSAFWTYFWRI